MVHRPIILSRALGDGRRLERKRGWYDLASYFHSQMGQKVHPIGFRLGITQPHLSKWFAKKENYSKYLCEDYFLRKKLQQQFGNAGFDRIEISRKIENHLEIVIYAEKPYVIAGLKGKDLKIFQQNIKQNIEKYRKSKFFQANFFSNNHQKKINKSTIRVKLHILGCSTTRASSIANFLIESLESRSSYRYALNSLFRKKFQKKPGSKIQNGIKIQISGRLNGAEIARREWMRAGRLPLQTLQANIDYSYKWAHTIYGVLGVKVWVFMKKKNRKLS